MNAPEPKVLDFSGITEGPQSAKRQIWILRQVWRHQLAALPGQAAQAYMASLPKGRAGTGNPPWTKRMYRLNEEPWGDIENLVRRGDIDVYFCPTLFRHGSGATDADVLPSLALFQDLDAVDPREIPEDLQPTIAWQTSPGSYQAVWLLDGDALDGEQLADWQKRLQTRLGVKDYRAPSSVIRVPGRRNWKGKYGSEGAEGVLLWKDGPTHDLSSAAWQSMPSTPKKAEKTSRGETGAWRAKVEAIDAASTRTSVWQSLPADIKRYLKEDDIVDRSAALWAIERELLSAGLSVIETAAVVLACPIGESKWGSRDISGLRTEIEKAVTSLDDEEMDEGEVLLRTPDEINRRWKHAIATYADLENYPRSDLGNGRRFVERYRDAVRYVDNWRSWVVWGEQHWQRKGSALAREMAMAEVERMMWNKRGTDKPFAWAVRQGSTRHITAMLVTAQSNPSVVASPDDFDSDIWLLGIRNGVINLRTGEYRETQPQDMITLVAPVEYDQNATCPTWDRCVIQWFPDEEVRAYVRRAVGYSLTGSLKEKCFFVLEGKPDAGKSKFIEALMGLLGHGTYAATMRPETLLVQKNPLGNDDDLASIVGARFVSMSELRASMRLDIRRIKQITGVGDEGRIKVMRKYESAYEATPHLKIWVDTNEIPKMGHRDDAMYERFKRIPFGKPLPKEKRDPNLEEKLKAELPGILNWALAGLHDWHDGGLREPQAVKIAVEAHRTTEDKFGQFLANRCRPGKGVKKTALKEAYKEWEGLPRLTTPDFNKILVEHGIDPIPKSIRIDGKTETALAGYELLPDEEDVDEPLPEGDDVEDLISDEEL